MKVLKVLLFLVFGFSIFSSAQEKFKDPLHLTLSQGITLASRENAQIFAANERVRQAINNISVNRSALLPQVTGTFGGKRQTEDLRASGIKLSGDPHIGPFNSFDTRGRLTMDIFDPEAIERLHSAKAGEKLSQVELRKIRQDILSLAGVLFLEAQRASQSVAFNEVNLKEAQHQYELAQLRLKQGTGSTAQLDKSKMDLAQAEYLFKVFQVHAEQTRLDLASALRIPLDQEIVFDDDLAWINKELQQSSVPVDVALAQAQVDESKTGVAQARAGFWPKITFSGDYGRSGESTSAASNTYALGAAVSLPIWEGGLRQAELASAKSKAREDEILLDDAKNQNQVKIKEAQGNLEQAKDFLTFKSKQIDYAQHQWLLANNRLQSGLGSQLEVDEASSTKAQAADDKNEAQALYWTAKINLAHAMGNIEKMFDIK